MSGSSDTNAVNNAAGRLARVLERASTAKPHHRQARKVWEETLNAPAGEPLAVLALLGGVLELPAQIRSAFTGLNEDPGPWLRPIQPIEDALLELSLVEPFERWWRRIDGPPMDALSALDRYLSARAPEVVIDRTALERWEDTVERLISEVLGDDELDHELRALLLVRLRGLLRAIREYGLRGAHAVEDEIFRMVGEVTGRTGRFRDRPVVRRVLEFYLIAASFLGVTSDAVSLQERFFGELPSAAEPSGPATTATTIAGDDKRARQDRSGTFRSADDASSPHPEKPGGAG